MTRSISICTSVLLAMALLIAPAAQAGLPKSKNKTIVPGVSIGGISLKTKVAKAKKKWKGGACNSTDVASYTYCTYTTDNPKLGSATFGGDKKVAFIQVSAGYDPLQNKQVFKGALKKFKTKHGIGLGSKLSKVKRKYNAKEIGDNAFMVKGGKRSYMVFTGDASGKISGISLSSSLGG